MDMQLGTEKTIFVTETLRLLLRTYEIFNYLIK